MKGKIPFPWMIFLVALIIRLVPVVLTRSLGIGLDDMFQYDMLARSLASGNGFRWYVYEDLQRLTPYVRFDLSAIDYDPERGVLTSFRAPLYPGFLALIYFLTGAGPERFFGARLVQAGLNALLAPLTYLLAKRLFPGNERASRISAWIMACYPMLIIYPLGLATENLFFLLVLAGFYFLIRSSDDPVPKNVALAGLFLALAALTRSIILPFLGVSLLWFWFIQKQRPAALLMALIMVILISPWVARNSILHKKLTGIESSLGYNLYVGYHPEGDGSFLFGPSLDLISILDDAERDHIGTQKALDYIRAEPQRFLPLAVNRLGFLFGLEKRALMYFYSNNLLGFIDKPALLALAGVFLLPFVLLSIFATAGVALTRMKPETGLLYALLFLYILPHIFILSEDRFHLAILPYLAILACQAGVQGWAGIVNRWRESLAGKTVMIVSALVILLLVVNWGLEISGDMDKITALLGPGGNQTYFSY